VLAGCSDEPVAPAPEVPSSAAAEVLSSAGVMSEIEASVKPDARNAAPSLSNVSDARTLARLLADTATAVWGMGFSVSGLEFSISGSDVGVQRRGFGVWG